MFDFRSHLPTIRTDGKAEVGRVREEKGIRKKIREETESAEKDPGARKRWKSRETKRCVFPIFCGAWSKSSLATAASAEPSGEMRDEKLHAVVARSRFGSQNVTNTSGSKHFWKLKC